MRKAIKQQLQYVRRDIGYIDNYLLQGYGLKPKHMLRLETIKTMYEQQVYMYENRVHSVPDRIVSLSQPYIRPIVRGKAKAPTEFGAKLDISIDEQRMARIEKISFDAYNESEVLPQAVERYKQRTGHYPERVLVDQIYRKIMCKLPITTKGAISLAILAMNLDRIAAIFLAQIGYRLFFSFIRRIMGATAAQNELLTYAG